MKRIKAEFFLKDTVQIAKNLVGKTLVYEDETMVMAGIIKETEAYTEDDPASHSYLGKKTNRNQSMFLSPGSIYIYRIYGIYFCLNFSCRPKGIGEAVLIRELVPTHGIDRMLQNRQTSFKQLTNGPAKLVQALGISPKLDGCTYHESSLYVAHTATPSPFTCVRSYPRIGISKGCERLWRFRGE